MPNGLVPLGWGQSLRSTARSFLKVMFPQASSCSEANSKRRPLITVKWEVRTSCYNQAKGQNTPLFSFWSPEICHHIEATESVFFHPWLLRESLWVEPGSGICTVRPKVPALGRAVRASQTPQFPPSKHHIARDLVFFSLSSGSQVAHLAHLLVLVPNFYNSSN